MRTSLRGSVKGDTHPGYGQHVLAAGLGGMKANEEELLDCQVCFLIAKR